MENVHVVLSKDRGDFIFVTTDPKKAEIEAKKQQEEEEMMGGRPSVYILKTKLIK